MHYAWLWYSLFVLLAWGVTGIFQKLSTNNISTETTMILLIVGFGLITPFVLPDKPLQTYSKHALVYGLLSGFLSDLGAWGLFEAMKSGGSASLVTVFTTLYPLPVVLLAPLVLHEHMTRVQAVAVVLALISAVLLAMEPKSKDSVSAHVRDVKLEA